MKKMLLLINPQAGKGGFRRDLGDILLTFHRAGYEATVTFTDGRGDERRIAEEAAGKYDRIVCVGGDGTLGETISGLLKSGLRPELGYIPMGTTNDCAVTLGISQNPVEAADVAVSGTLIDMDVGCFNGSESFTYVAAFGAFTEVSYETPQEQKNNLGRLAYILDGMRRLPTLTHKWARVEYDDGVLEDEFIFGAVTNSRSVAGLIHLDESTGMSLSDGLFEILLIRKPENALQLGTIISDVMFNRFDGSDVMLMQSKKVRFTFHEEVAWTVDGEDGGKHTEVLCENIPAAMRIVVGKDFNS